MEAMWVSSALAGALFTHLVRCRLLPFLLSPLCAGIHIKWYFKDLTYNSTLAASSACMKVSGQNDQKAKEVTETA